MHSRMQKFTAVGLCWAAIALVSAPIVRGDDGDLQEKIKQLEFRIAELEGKATAGEWIAKSDVPESTLKFLQGTEISGFVSASYTYNFNVPDDRTNAGRLYDFAHSEFMFNKLTLVMQKPVEPSPFDWKAGFFTEFIFGQDAGSTQAAGLSLGDQGDLEQAYIQINVPVGNGLQVIFGKYVTPIGYELVENEWNANWSGGWQWTFIEPFTHTGLQLSYQINDQWDAQVLVNNGWDNVKDNNTAKSYMGRIGYAPNDKTSIGLIGYGGPEMDDNNHDWRKGVSLLVTHQCTEKLNTAVQLDYGQEEGGDINGGTAEWWAAGVWAIYDITEKMQLALRGDFLKDRDGNRTSDFLFPVNTGQDLWSLTATLNIKPVEELRIAPEIRYDHSSLDTAFDGHDSQVTAGIGVVYSY
jgi:hypothetical protein